MSVPPPPLAAMLTCPLGSILLGRAAGRAWALGDVKHLPLHTASSSAPLGLGHSGPRGSCAAPSQIVTYLQDTEQDHEPPYEISVQEEITARLHFVKFENTYIEACLDFIKDHLVNTETKVIQATGGGAYKFKDLIEEKLRLK